MPVPYVGELPMPREEDRTNIVVHNNIIIISNSQSEVIVQGSGNCITISSGVKILRMEITGSDN